MANLTRAGLGTVRDANFPTNNNNEITASDLRDWLTDGIDSFLTQKDKNVMEEVIWEAKSNNLTAGATTDLNLANGNFVHITGTTTTINSFGICDAGSRFILVFKGVYTLDYDATQLILPGTANITTANNDCCMIVSEGSGNWRVVGYFPIAGGGGGGTVTSVTATTPLASSGGSTPDISIQQANSSQDGYLSSTDWNTFDGKQDALSAGTGISLASNTVTNTAPDQVVALTAGTGISTSGTYPNFTIANTAPDQTVGLTAGTGIGITGTYPNFTISNTSSGSLPGGADTEVQYNNAGTFGGIPELTYSGGFVEIKTPKIGTSNGNGHIHIHSANSAPTGITDYLTMFWQKATRALGFRSETDTYETYIQLTAPTADRTITIPDATGNVVIDTTVPSFSNGASAGEIRFKEAGGSNYVGIKAAASLSADTTFTLPVGDGANGQVIVTNGSGQLLFANNGGTLPTQYLRNYVNGQVTNTLANTIAQSLLIPANTFSSNNGFRFEVKVDRTGNSGGFTYNAYINTSVSLSGAILVATNTMGTGINSTVFTRGFSITSSTTTRHQINNFQVSDYVNWAGALSSSNIDWTINQYLIVSFGLTINTTVVNCVSIDIYPI